MNAIIVFLKNFFLTDVKTRLAETTSQEFALNFYKDCIKNTITEVKKTSIPYFLFWYPEPIEKYKNSFSQKGKNLGERMYNALNEVFANKIENAIIIGTDIPDLNSNIMRKAFIFLKDYDYVIGPCFDGGYYLIGCKKDKLKKEIFSDIPWSTDKVFTLTIEKLKKHKLKFYVLEKLRDIDEQKDLFNYYSSKR